MKQRKHSKHFGLMLMFTVIVFFALLINSAVTSLAVFLLVKSGILYVSSAAQPHAGSLILFNALISIPIGFLISVIAVKFPLKPIRNLIEGMDALAAGDFKIRMNTGSIMRRYPAFVEVSESFNKMAQELECTEMLRGDFINNFSHEFKTPIVSIAGFAKLLKRGNLTQELQREYLDIIEEESMRLSYKENHRKGLFSNGLLSKLRYKSRYESQFLPQLRLRTQYDKYTAIQPAMVKHGKNGRHSSWGSGWCFSPQQPAEKKKETSDAAPWWAYGWSGNARSQRFRSRSHGRPRRQRSWPYGRSRRSSITKNQGS